MLINDVNAKIEDGEKDYNTPKICTIPQKSDNVEL